MKAIVIHPNRSDGPAKMQYEDISDPIAAPRQIVIQVAAASVNRSDLMRRDNYRRPADPSATFIPGTDVAGFVESVGESVEEIRPGDMVAALLSGGGYASRVATHVAGATPVPPGVDATVAASVPVVYLTCWFPLVLDPGVERGQTVLIQSGASGVGIAGIQIAKHLGARVFATAGSDEKVARLRDFGVDLAINYSTTDFLPAVLDATKGRGVDFVLESVGGDVFTKSLAALAPGGSLVNVGNSSGAPDPVIDDALVAERSLSVSRFGLPSEIPTGGTRRELPKILELVAKGTFQPVIDQTFPLSEADAAHERLAARRNVGKVLLIP